jgi:hypothetical protein
VGKIIVAFVGFVAASVLAVRETRPIAAASTPSPSPSPLTSPITSTITSTPTTVSGVYEPAVRVVHEAPPWVKYAIPVPTITVDEGDIVDVSDKCPDQPTDNEDGCPEPEGKERVIRLEMIY